MTVFPSVASALTALRRDIRSAVLGEIKEMAKMVVEENVKSKGYGTFSANTYERTNDLMNSVDVEVINGGIGGVGFKVYMNTSKIRPMGQTSSGEWGQHTDNHGDSQAENIPLWIEEGHGGFVAREGTHYMESAYQELMTKCARDLANSLRGKGWDVVTI